MRLLWEGEEMLFFSTILICITFITAFYAGRKSVQNQNVMQRAEPKEKYIGRLTPGEIKELQEVESKRNVATLTLQTYLQVLKDYGDANHDFWYSIEDRLGVHGKKLRYENNNGIFEIYEEVKG